MLEDGVAVRVSSLCLDSRGWLADLLICSAAVPAALLLDLAMASRVTSTDDAVEIDAEPTGFEPADRLLAAVVAEPGRPLDGWLHERRLGVADVAAANVVSGRWDRRAGSCDVTSTSTTRRGRPGVTSPAPPPTGAT